MTTKEQDYKERLIAVLRDVRENLRDDREAMWLIGSLATRLVDLYKVRDWSQFKAKLTAPAYDQLLKDFEQQGNGYHQAGNARAAYAVQLLAISAVARTQRAPEIRQGEALLDGAINSMISLYRKTVAEQSAKTN